MFCYAPRINSFKPKGQEQASRDSLLNADAQHTTSLPGEIAHSLGETSSLGVAAAIHSSLAEEGGAGEGVAKRSLTRPSLRVEARWNTRLGREKEGKGLGKGERVRD